MDKNKRGAISELLASAYLLEQGYDVYKNIRGHGPVDLITWKFGEAPRYFDVKTVCRLYRSNGDVYYQLSSRLSDIQKESGVEIIHVYPDGSVGIGEI